MRPNSTPDFPVRSKRADGVVWRTAGGVARMRAQRDDGFGPGILMRILVISQFFPPEMGAPAGRFYDFAQHWTRHGHRVTVVTGFPNFPGGAIHQGYRRRVYQREVIDGIDVRRCWLLTSRKRFLGRALAYATFLFSSTLCVLLARLAYDIVVTTSPPPTTGLPGLAAAWRRWLTITCL